MKTVKIIYGGQGNGHMAKVVDAETGELIKGVTSADIHLGIEGLPYAVLCVLNPEVEYTGNASFVAQPKEITTYTLQHTEEAIQ